MLSDGHLKDWLRAGTADMVVYGAADSAAVSVRIIGIVRRVRQTGGEDELTMAVTVGGIRASA